MKPKSIGIIGGAGPIAGAFLLERLFILSNKKYGCYRDADFPKVFLLSFPFSEMLCENKNTATLRQELNTCLKQLRQNGASVIAIACNTLHAFLDETDKLSDVIHLPSTIVEKIPAFDVPLVFCTSTAAQSELHKQFFTCAYPDAQTQRNVDDIIDQILKGVDRSVVLAKLITIIQSQTANTVILGCTELSLFSTQLSVINKLIIDPLEITANKILEISFNRS